MKKLILMITLVAATFAFGQADAAKQAKKSQAEGADARRN